MPSPISILLLLQLPLALALSPRALQDGETVELDLDPEVVELLEEVAHIPFSTNGSRPIPVVEAMVNGEGPFRFYYDTGASVCVLDSGFVERLGIEILGQTKIGDHTASDRIDADQVEIDSLELEGIRFERIPAVAFDRSAFGGGDIQGVLGLPLFRDHLLTVDYGKGRLEISSETLPEEGQGILPYGGGLLPEIKITLGGQEHSIHIDSGSPGGFTLPASVVQGLAHKTEPTLVGRARTVNSEFEIWSVQLDATLDFAGIEYADPVVGYNEILPLGLVGYQVLKDLVLSIDQRSKRVRFLRGA
jgi:hypothetical protein